MPIVAANALSEDKVTSYAAAVVAQALDASPPASVSVLSLSGHWQQLSALGNSLNCCTALTELDLSRNGLSSLDGLASLRKLVKINLYYNVIGELSALDALSAHPVLEDLDLRLNPVTHAGRRHRLRALVASPSLRTLDVLLEFALKKNLELEHEQMRKSDSLSMALRECARRFGV